MKKRLLCLTLACGLVLGTASAAFASFRDITDPKVQQDAAALNSLGIMQGVGNQLFEPEAGLTRAQFCKLAATALGCTDVTGYASYTIFPDVPHNHWAAGYINAVVKHPDIEKKQVIRGFADGTFGPDQSITYGEACTMLLRMLDYTVEDIGPNWPADYISRAQSMGITNGVDVSNANAVVKRGDAAVMLCNTLSTNTKDGSSLLSKLSGSAVVSDSILLATEETDPSLGFGQLKFYENGDLVTRSGGEIDSVLVGTMGTVIFDKNASARVKSFLPDNDNMESHTVRSATQDTIETDNGSFTVPRKTPLVVGGEVRTYSEAWFDVMQGDQVNFYYDESRQLQLIAVDNKSLANDAFVYGLGDASIPQGYKLLLNGVEIKTSQLQKYHVITLNQQNKTAIVSDKKLTGAYLNASPSFAQPEKITLLGKEFFIPETVAPRFAGLQRGGNITLLLDHYGNVRDVRPASEVRADMVGVLTSLEEGQATVELCNGLTLRGPLYATPTLNLVGKFVKVSDEDGKMWLTNTSTGSKRSGDWDVQNNSIGSAKVSPDARLYEQVASNAPMSRIDRGDLEQKTVDNQDIRTTVTDSAGNVVCMVLGDVTGQGWDFGVADYVFRRQDVGDEIYTDGYPIELTCLEDGQMVVKKYKSSKAYRSLDNTPVGIPKGFDAYTDSVIPLELNVLEKVGTVSGTDFNRSEGVKVGSTYYELTDETIAYVPRLNQMMTLREARANYTSFTLYADGTPDEGGKIRVVYAE